jgi:CPA2 family monovalent cation:H+ antiporter-2
MALPAPAPDQLLIPIMMLAAAVLTTSLVTRLRVSPVLGYLLAGFLIGPAGLGLIAANPTTHFLAELGVVFLLFAIGLELPLERLRVMRRWVFGFGGVTTTTLFAIFAGIGFAILGKWPQAAVVGGALMFTSTALLVQILSERGEFQTRYGRASFSASLFQDLMVVPILVAIPLLSLGEEALLQSLGSAVIKAVLALIAIMYLGRWLLRPFYHFIVGNRNHELLTAMTLLVVLGFSLATFNWGLSLALGAFLAGVILAETEFRHQIAADIEPFLGLLLGLFFMTVGMMVDINGIHGQGWALAAIVFGLVAIKMIVFYSASRAFDLSKPKALKATLVLSQGSEFGFVVLALATAEKLLPPDVIALLTVAIVLSMVLSVVLVRLGWDELSRMQAAAQKPGEETLAEEDFKDRKNHIVIIGFGRVGEVVAAMCALCGLPYIVLDNDHQRVAKARTKDLPVFYGDAAKIQVLRSVGVERARAVVVAASNAKYATQIVHVLRHEWANVPLFGRARDSEHAKQLVEAGITAAVPITLQASLELGATVLQHLGLQPPDIQQIADNVRTGQGF